MSDRSARMALLAQEITNLTASPLYELRQQKQYHPVIGEGNLEAQIMFVGEAPGEAEAKSGRPFVGASGRFLNELLASIGLQRQDVYITNVVKDRPPENRDPTPQEIALYSPILVKQIDIICPVVIVTLGRFAMEFILKLLNAKEQGGKISALHGKVISAQASYGAISIVPLFHPAVALYTAARRDELLADFQVLKSMIGAT
ncbi:MAG: uracil-DNA glycosylase [Caldilineaceae bacterium]